MKLNFKSRSWHTWTSVILALPILLVALSAIFIAHRKSLASEEIRLSPPSLPGYADELNKAGGVEPRVALAGADGQLLIGTNNGLFEQRDGRLVAVEALANTPVRDLAEAPWGRIVAARNGVWVSRQGTWSRAVKGEAWSLTTAADGRVTAAVKDQGLLVSRDGQAWQVAADAMSQLAGLPADPKRETISLHRLVIDLHSGRALFGREREWIWIDLIGAALTLLGLTGLWMWSRAERRRAQAATRGLA